MGFLSRKSEKRQQMDLLQKTQETLELTQQNLSLLVSQNQASLAESQSNLQQTLTCIEAALGKTPEHISVKKVYSPEEKERAAYALNCCTISVSQIVDYDDIYILEQEYESILNNLNLENMPKDEALLDIYKQLLDTITFFRIQEGDKAMMEQEYQNKVKNAIWSAVPQISLAGLAHNPIGAAINLATQVGIGYMNYRREKAEIQSEQEKQKWQLTRSAMEQFNGLRRELFTTAWLLADEYDFADNLRITEQQISVFNKILLEPDDLKRYERLNYIKDSFEAYTPFWYHLGNAANKAAKNMSNEDAEKYRKIAEDSYRKYIDKTEDKKMNLFRCDHIRAACTMELFELKGKRREDVELLVKAKDAAGSNFDVLEICALSYLQIDEIEKAKEILRMLVNENYNAVVNAQILSSIYVNEYLAKPGTYSSAKLLHSTLQTRVDPIYLFPMPNTPSLEESALIQRKFLEKQKICVLRKYSFVLTQLIERYTLKFNQAIPAASKEATDPQWYFSDDPEAIKFRMKDIQQGLKQNQADQYMRSLGIAVSDMLDVLNELCVIMEDFPYTNGDMFAYNVKSKVGANKEKFKSIIEKVASYRFAVDDVPLLFQESFGELTRPAFLSIANEIRDTVRGFENMKDVSFCETQLHRFCIEKEFVFPLLTLNQDSSLPSQGKARYISINMLDLDKQEFAEEISRVEEMQEIIAKHTQSNPLVKANDKDMMIVLTKANPKFTVYRDDYLSMAHHSHNYFGDPLLIICHEKLKNSVDDLILTTKGIVHFEKGKIKDKEWPLKLYIYPPVAYTNVNKRRDGIHIGTYFVSYDSKFIDATSLAVLINSLAPKQKTSKDSPNENNSQDVIRNNLANEVEDELLAGFGNHTQSNIDQAQGENIGYDVGTGIPEDGIIQQIGERQSKNADGSFWVVGTVASEYVICNEFCYIDGFSSKYHVREIRFEGWQTNIAKLGQTASFRLYDSSM